MECPSGQEGMGERGGQSEATSLGASLGRLQALSAPTLQSTLVCIVTECVAHGHLILGSHLNQRLVLFIIKGIHVFPLWKIG